MPEPRPGFLRRLLGRESSADFALVVAEEVAKNLQNLNKQPTKRRFDINMIVVALIAAAGPVGTAIPTYYKHDQIDCVTARRDAIKLITDNPEIDVPYVGPPEDQCQLNEVVKEASKAPRP